MAFKMKSSPVRGKLGEFFSGLGKKLKEGTARRVDKKYKNAGPNVKRQMDKEGYAKPIARTPGSFSTQQELEGNLVPNQEFMNKKTTKSKILDKPKTKVTGALGSKTRKEQYDAKGWKYDDTIKGYNTDGTKKKNKATKFNVNSFSKAQFEKAKK